VSAAAQAEEDGPAADGGQGAAEHGAVWRFGARNASDGPGAETTGQETTGPEAAKPRRSESPLAPGRHEGAWDRWSGRGVPAAREPRENRWATEADVYGTGGDAWNEPSIWLRGRFTPDDPGSAYPDGRHHDDYPGAPRHGNAYDSARHDSDSGYGMPSQRGYEPPFTRPAPAPRAYPGPVPAGLEVGPAASPGRGATAGYVIVIPGTPRYHKPGCLLIRFLGKDDTESVSRREAEDAGCAPCRACQPDKGE